MPLRAVYWRLPPQGVYMKVALLSFAFVLALPLPASTQQRAAPPKGDAASSDYTKVVDVQATCMAGSKERSRPRWMITVRNLVDRTAVVDLTIVQGHGKRVTLKPHSAAGFAADIDQPCGST